MIYVLVDDSKFEHVVKVFEGDREVYSSEIVLDKLTEAIEALSVTFDTREILVNTSADLETQIRSIFNAGLAQKYSNTFDITYKIL